MPVMEGSTSVAANTLSANVLAGEVHQILQANAQVSFYATGSAAGLRYRAGEGVFEVGGGANVSVQPATRQFTISFGRTAVAKEIERFALRIGGIESYRSARYRLFMRRLDTIQTRALGGALGDRGEVWVSMQQLTGGRVTWGQ